MTKINKGWGHEAVIATFPPHYTMKTLHFNKAGNCFSMHLHRDKHEHWLITSGSFRMDTIDTRTGVESSQVLHVGDWREIRPMTPHRLTALEYGSEVVECSTPDDPGDNYRVSPGDSQKSKATESLEIDENGNAVIPEFIPRVQRQIGIPPEFDRRPALSEEERKAKELVQKIRSNGPETS